MKLHVAGFTTKMLKVSHTSLAPALIWQRTNIKKGMITYQKNPLANMQKVPPRM